MKWSKFKEEIKNEAPRSSKFQIKREDGSTILVYRGQANHEWRLESTLERAGHATMSLGTYMRKCDSARRYMGNLIPNELKFEDPRDCDYSYRNFRSLNSIPNYEYLAYLRHHGFPSPLLDWTESPFVAAFFGFRHIDRTVDKVSIFAYREHTPEHMTVCSSEPHLMGFGPFATVHERHFVQQCWYTLCVKEDKENVLICPHWDGLVNAVDPSKSSRDQLLRWDIDASERDTVLGDLFQMNITPFSLFRNIDTAAETAALRIFGK